MKSLPKPNHADRLESLIAAHCDGILDSHGEKQLAEMLENDREARRFYLHYLDLHLELSRRTEVSNLVPMPLPRQRGIRAWQAVAAIAILTTILTGALLWHREKIVEEPVAIESAEGVVEDGPVAYVSRAVDVEWNYRMAAEPGLELISGDAINLASGKVRIEFSDGSSATIEGPADFRLLDSREIELETGRIIVRSDGPVPGFTVRTPGAAFVDVGTEFALSVVDAMGTKMQVIEGEVIATVLSADSVALDERSAFAGTYLTVAPDSGIAEADLAPEEFTEMLDPSALPLKVSTEYVAAVRASSPVGYWRFEKMQADGFAENSGGDAWAIALGDPKLEGDSNKSLLLDGDETRRGLFVDSAFTNFSSGEYSVEMWFNSQSQQHSGLVSLVEIDADSIEAARGKAPEHRMMAIETMSGERTRWSRAPQGKISFSHRIMRFGETPGSDRSGRSKWSDKKKWDKEKKEGGWKRPGHNDGHRNIRDDEDHDDHGGNSGWNSGWHHEQGGSNRGKRTDQSRDERGGYHGRFASGSRDFESRVFTADRYIPGNWHHVVAVREADQILLYLDGELQATTAAKANSDPVDVKMIIGRYSLANGWLGRPFHGRIDELALYDRALTADEIRDHASLAE